MDINPITLRYYDRELEQSFRQEYAEKSIKQIRFAILIPIFIYFLSETMNRFSSPEYVGIAIGLKFGIFTPLLLIILATTYRRNSPQVIQIMLVVVSLIMALSFTIGISSEAFFISIFTGKDLNNYILFTINTALILVTVYTYTATRLLFTYAISTALVILAIYNITAFFVVKPTLSMILFTSNFQLFLGNLIGGFAGYLMELYLRRDFLKSSLLEIEIKKSEQLLLNILPEAIANRLKEDSATIADSFDEVTILFADIVGFTKLYSQISPVELVELLNQIFSAFDELAEKHGLEKIKTIGDAYMIVGGIPEPRVDHAEAIAEMALDMQAAVLKINQQTLYKIAIRIGINSGEVIAGVIGKKKFIYDLWGDAVNTASRMESHGIPNSIHVTMNTYHRLAEKYLWEERGIVEVKGKGEMQTYILKGKLA